MATPEATLAVDELPDGIVVADQDGLVVLVNRRAEDLLGLAPGTATGRPLAEVLTLVDPAGRTWVGVNPTSGVLPARVLIQEQSWFAGSGAEVLTTARIRRCPDGRLAGITVALRPGPDRVGPDGSRSDLIETVAHELRSPLSGVRGFVHALLQRWTEFTDDQRRLLLETVAADADRLGRLIGELLNVSRLDRGRLRLDPRPVDLGQLAARVVSSVGAATSRPIALTVAEGLPLGMADPDRFQQVVTNLVENAVRHGSGRVLVSVDPAGADALEISVSDEGEGIPAELRDRVFTKFWSGHGGSGLGLYLVRGITEAHGGSVRVEDAAGARLVVTWPAAPGD